MAYSPWDMIWGIAQSRQKRRRESIEKEEERRKIIANKKRESKKETKKVKKKKKRRKKKEISNDYSEYVSHGKLDISDGKFMPKSDSSSHHSSSSSRKKSKKKSKKRRKIMVDKKEDNMQMPEPDVDVVADTNVDVNEQSNESMQMLPSPNESVSGKDEPAFDDDVNNVNKNEIAQSVEAVQLESQLSEGTNDQNIEHIEPKIEEMQNNGESSIGDCSEVYDWLKSIGLGKGNLIHILLEHGFEGLQVIKLMTVSDMNAMKIHKIGWRKGLTHGIAALNQNKKRKVVQIKEEIDDDIEILEPPQKKQRKCVQNESSKNEIVCIKETSSENSNSSIDLALAETANVLIKFCPKCKSQMNRSQHDIDIKCGVMTCTKCDPWTYWCWDCSSVMNMNDLKFAEGTDEPMGACKECRRLSRIRRNKKKIKTEA